jgi:type IV pilus assembly protein PilM
MNLQLGKKGGIGVDLGHHRIKMLELDSTSSGWKVTNYASIATPEGAIRDGIVVDFEAVGAAMKKLHKDGKFSSSRVNLAAAGGSVFVRPVVFPKMSDATLRKTIRFEASRYLPGSVEESHIDFTILGPTPDGQMNVVVVAAPKDIVNSRLKATQAAGLDVEAVDVEAFAIFRALLESVDSDLAAKTTAIVDIGAASTSVSVIHEKAFAMNRSIPYGGDTLTDALITYFKLSAADAEEGKSQLDLRLLMDEDSDNDAPPLRVVQPHVEDLIREVRRSLNYFQSQGVERQAPRKVEALLLSGGGSKLAGIEKYFESKLGLPVTLARVFDHPMVVLENPHAADSATEGLDFTVAGGLAMRNGFKAA